MSGYYEEPAPRWFNESKNHSMTISITSVVALIEGLQEMGCKTDLKISELSQLENAQTQFNQALQALEEGQYMSLEQATKYEQLAENTIQAAQHLQQCIEAVESIDAKEINVVDTKGVQRKLVKTAGAYRTQWSETWQSSDRGGTRNRNDGGGGAFSKALRKANEDAQKRRIKRMKETTSQLKKRSQGLGDRLEKAGNIRAKWQTIHDHRNLQTLRQERAATGEARLKERGFSTKRLVDNNNEIVISARRRG
jgi:hypothetical protein